MARTRAKFLSLKLDKTVLFAGFRSPHDLRFLEKRVNTSIFCIHQGKKTVQKVQKNAVI